VRTFVINWDKTLPLYNPSDDLAVVVFLQDEETREVYQTEIKGINDPDVTTGIEDMNKAFNVYPNPADKEMTIELPEISSQPASLKMFDQMGKIVNQSVFEKGQQRKLLDTTELAGGMYLIQIQTSKGILSRKVMVIHEH
jgi:hypothetical protein